MTNGAIEWNYSFFGNAAEYALSVRSAGTVTLTDASGQRQRLGLPERSHEYAVFGGWEAESFRRDDSLQLYFRCPLSLEAAEKRLNIAFEAETDVAIAPRNAPDKGKSFSAILSVSIVPNQSVWLTPAKPLSVPVTETESQESEDLRRELADSQRELDELRERLGERERELASVRRVPDGNGAEAEKLREERETWRRQADELRETKTALYALAKSGLNDWAQWLSVHREHLSDELREQAEAAEKTDAEIRDMESRLKDGQDGAARRREERERLQKELEGLRALEADLSLDCDAAQREMDGVRARLGDDADSLALLREDSSVSTASVDKLLKDAEENLNAAETGLSRIIRWRETMNASVYQSIMSGIGQLPLARESEDGKNGGN